MSDIQRLLRTLMSNKRLYMNKRLFLHKRNNEDYSDEVNKTEPIKRSQIRLPFKRYRMYKNFIQSLQKDATDRKSKNSVTGGKLGNIIQKILSANRNVNEEIAGKDKSKMFPIPRIG